MTWLGHATVLIELGRLRVLTDPLLRGRVAHLRRHVPVPDVPASLDAVLLSHLHRDHADGPSLRRLPGDLPVVAPAGSAAVVRHLGPSTVIELEVGGRVAIGPGAVVAVHAEHDGRRSPVHSRVPALGYVVEAGGCRVYFAGDTERFAGMAELGPLDAALLPIWGWGPTLGPGHLDPDQAAEATALIRPQVVVPIHWATYLPIGSGSDHELLREPGPAFATAVRKLDPSIRVALLHPGDSLDIPGSPVADDSPSP